MRRALVSVLVLALLGAAAYGAWWWWQEREERAREQARRAAEEAATAYLDAWEARDLAGMDEHATGDEQLDAVVGELYPQLRMSELTLEPVPAELVSPERRDAATVDVTAEAQLEGLGTWSWDVTLELREVTAEGGEPRWLVEWSPSAVHPQLTPDTKLARSRTWPERAPILDRDGQPLDAEGTSLGLVLGHLGEITPDLIEQLDDPYLEGDTVGLRGLQLAFEQQLAGTPTGEVQLLDASGEVVEVLHRVEGTAPQPLQTTLDPAIQRRAEAALATASSPSAMVVLDAPTSEILAVVNRPGADFNRAFSGRYPPGSTFKVVTATAILRDGVTPDTSVSCPEEATVHGRRFRNFEGEAFGDIPFAEAFYRSCNTAFVQLAADLDDGALDTAAADYGFGTGWSLPVGSVKAAFPEPVDLAQRAAAAIGQAQVEAAPVQMASIAAAVSAGRWTPPTLVRDAPSDVEDRDLGDVAPTLQDLMREVPRIGTAEGAGLPDGFAGKTGTAEYGSGDPLPTHAWFIGFQDDGDGPQRDLALALVVEGGESGGSVAAPVAARFLAEG